MKMNAKYISIYHKLIEQIEKGAFTVGSKIPSEKSLMEQFGVSRDTIRKSLQMLEQNGYINKVKGKGSFILDTAKLNFPVTGLISFKELSNQIGREAETIVEILEKKRPSKFISEQLEIDDQTAIWKVVRARKIDGKKIILDKEYYNSAYVEKLSRSICEGSIFDYIENTLHLNIGFAKKEIVVQASTEDDQKYLDLDGYDMVVVVNTFVYLDDGSLLQYGQSRHRPDKFKFVDFARRIQQVNE
ncbi:trehalose operon repressor [Gottfriedia acidiceleris]|uniref:trehalose operon repressor n=1 Tax=Gottfriedia acidiceleris TaxID=371036 RepID=UPI001BB0B8CD|nr:trehalose operon repressor [Gottfriedia acidiceleris]